MVFFFSYITIVVNLYSTGFCVYWFFNRYSTGFFFLSYIIIVFNIYGIAHGIYIYIYIYILLVFVFTAYTSIYLFICFWFLCLLVFSICIVLVILFYFFSYITIIVNLYDTAHGKKIKELFLVFGFCVYSIHQYIYIYIF